MPAFPLTDAHVHFWDPTAGRYAWLDAVPALAGRRGPAEFARACGPVAVERLVFVQCGAEDALAEVAWVDGLAAAEPRLAAIVAHAPVEARAPSPDRPKLGLRALTCRKPPQRKTT